MTIMEHATIRQLESGLFEIKPDAGYEVRTITGNRSFGIVQTDDVTQYYIAEKGSEPTPTPTPVPEPQDPLERAKQRKLAEITAYDKSDHVNVFYLNDVPMWLTVQERQQIATQISANEAIGRTEMGKWFGGHEFTFPLTTWKQMLVALEVYAGDALNVTEAHKAAVMVLESVESVEAYDITVGYPEKIRF